MTKTLFELLKKYEVEIPILQRDYAQGREGEHEKRVRKQLLKDMRLAITGETQLDIHFVYGRAEKENGKFIPIDGQQRLTTLFLLHLYAFRNDKSKTELFRKFTYETRVSSRRFLKKLTEMREKVFASELVPSEEICESEWFVSSWKYDPTVKSILTMLDDIKIVFSGVPNLGQCLAEKRPIVFKFRDMENLGMEDSLYIKLNARGKPLTLLENFKARLIGQLEKLKPEELKPGFAGEFEGFFDREWTDLFWNSNDDKASFDQIYLAFFDVLFMNNKPPKNKADRGTAEADVSDDANWSNKLDYDKINVETFETIFHTLNFLCADKPGITEEIRRLVFDMLKKDRIIFQDRVLFHAVTTYLHRAKGIDNGSLRQWLRIIRNLTLNSTIDNDTHRRAVNGINKWADDDHWYNLLEHFAKGESIRETGFSQDQIKEEQDKARIILRDKDFAEAIYEAEKHPYFSGQIRSALFYAKDGGGAPEMKTFVQYWNKIDELFDTAKPKHGNLLRRALLTFGDYTLDVKPYKTLCVNDPDEGSGTPSLKRLFSNHGEVVKPLLDMLDANQDIEAQLKKIIMESKVPENDWRYCFIKCHELFSWMSVSHLRLRDVDGNGKWFIMIRTKESSGYNHDVFLSALCELLMEKKITSKPRGEQGLWGDRYLDVGGLQVRFKQGAFIVKDAAGKETSTTRERPITEVTKLLESLPVHKSPS